MQVFIQISTYTDLLQEICVLINHEERALDVDLVPGPRARHRGEAHMDPGLGHSEAGHQAGLPEVS